MSLFAKAKKARENKKGFTLVELIVVLVILAILAAIMVPALTGWIDKAKEKQVVINARTAYLAAQTIASEDYAKPTPKYGGTVKITKADISKFLNGELKNMDTATEATVTSGKISSMTYKEGDKEYHFNGTTWDFIS